MKHYKLWLVLLPLVIPKVPRQICWELRPTTPSWPGRLRLILARRPSVCTKSSFVLCGVPTGWKSLDRPSIDEIVADRVGQRPRHSSVASGPTSARGPTTFGTGLSGKDAAVQRDAWRFCTLEYSRKPGELLLFDWESANWEAPSSWDAFHFQVQTGYSFRKSDGRYMPSEPGSPDKASFMLYVLNSVCQYLEEDNHKAIGLCQKLLNNQLRNTGVPSEALLREPHAGL